MGVSAYGNGREQYMYGEHWVNPHHTLRYGYTKEFIDLYRGLQYKGIEIPAVLIRLFHVWIQAFVNRQQVQPAVVRRMKMKHRFQRMSDIQRALSRKPKRERNLSVYAHRKGILMPARMASFALEQFARKKVVLIVSSPADREALRGKRLPGNFTVFDYKSAVKRVKIGTIHKKRVKQMIEKLSRRGRRHPFLARASFKRWLYVNALKSMRSIHALERLITKHPIGIVIDHIEIVNPGATLSLLAHKYGIPFVTIPQLLIADRSFIPARASHYFVWGKDYRDWMVRRGVPAGRIKIVGNIKFEEVMKRNRGKTNIRSRLHIPDDHWIVTVATQPFHHRVNVQLVRWIRYASRLNLPFIFVIKPHPFDFYPYRSAFMKHDNIRIVSNTTNIYELLKATDILATVSSNTAIEAAMFHKAIFVLQPRIPYDYDHHNNEFNAFLVKARAGANISRPEHLQRCLREYVDSPAYRNMLHRKSKLFLARTVQIKSSPKVLIRRLIVNLLK